MQTPAASVYTVIVGQKANETERPEEMILPLSGVRVLDLGRTFAAPWCTQNLADLGADVIKVERRGPGDEYRQYGPPFIRDAQGNETGASAQFAAINRNKRSLTVDFAKPAGQDVVRRLALQCDVLVENFKVGDLARYGLDYATIHALNANLIYCSITGFGQTGPYATRPATDSVFQAMSGLMSVTGEPEMEPQKVGVVIIDMVTGIYASSAIQAALRHREVNGGGGQHIDLALLEVAMAAMAQRSVEYLVEGTVPQRMGSASLGSAPAQVFASKDGYINVQAGGNVEFIALCDLMGLNELTLDPRYQSRYDRARHVDTLLPPIEAKFLERTSVEWYEAMVARNIICSPIYDVEQCFADPQVRSRDLLRRVHHPAGDIDLLANPIRFSETPLTRYDPPPEVGEHSAEVLSEFGFSDDEIANLRACEAI